MADILSKKKIMFVLPRMNGGGAERVVSILANHFSEYYDVTLLVLVSKESFYPLDERVKFISADFKVNRTNKFFRAMSLAFNFLRSVCFVRSAVSEDNPDIVFSILEEADIVTYLAMLGNKKAARICSERNDPTKRSKLMQFILRRIYDGCDMLVCQSAKVADYYENVPKEKKVVVPNPVDFSRYPERVPEGDKKCIVGVGRLRDQKNFRLLIDGFALISDRYENVNLVIYGEGSQREELERRISELGLEGRVELPGASRQVLMDIRDATVFVMSSDYEGFPNALVEAIAVGVPVISTDFSTGIARDIIKEDVGIVIPCGDKNALANALETLLSQPEKRRYIRENGYKSVVKFETDKVVEMWDELFASLEMSGI